MLSRRAVLAAGGGAVAVAAVVVAVVIASGGGSGATPSAASSSTPSASAAASTGSALGAAPSVPVPSDPVAAAAALPSSAAPVPLEGTVSTGGVSVSLASITAIDGHGSGPGNISGPALRVTVRVRNDGSAAFSLDGISVNLAYGGDLNPASPLDDPSAAPFHGMLQPGKVAEGTYVFTVPADARHSVSVQVLPSAGSPVAVFTGPAD
jgi:hypothetical protein